MRPIVGLAVGVCITASAARSSSAQGAATPADPPPALPLFMLGLQGPGAMRAISGAVIAQRPQEILQTIPVIVPAGDPASER